MCSSSPRPERAARSRSTIWPPPTLGVHSPHGGEFRAVRTLSLGVALRATFSPHGPRTAWSRFGTRALCSASNWAQPPLPRPARASRPWPPAVRSRGERRLLSTRWRHRWEATCACGTCGNRARRWWSYWARMRGACTASHGGPRRPTRPSVSSSAAAPTAPYAYGKWAGGARMTCPQQRCGLPRARLRSRGRRYLRRRSASRSFTTRAAWRPLCCRTRRRHERAAAPWRQSRSRCARPQRHPQLRRWGGLRGPRLEGCRRGTWCVRARRGASWRPSVPLAWASRTPWRAPSRA